MSRKWSVAPDRFNRGACHDSFKVPVITQVGLRHCTSLQVITRGMKSPEAIFPYAATILT